MSEDNRERIVLLEQNQQVILQKIKDIEDNLKDDS
jgi:hypothetical protein